jgi:hypothetical protein
LGGPTKGPCPCKEGSTPHLTPNVGIMAPVRQASQDTWAPVASMISNRHFAAAKKAAVTEMTPQEVEKAIDSPETVNKTTQGEETDKKVVLDTPKGTEVAT